MLSVAGCDLTTLQSVMQACVAPICEQLQSVSEQVRNMDISLKNAGAALQGVQRHGFVVEEDGVVVPAKLVPIIAPTWVKVWGGVWGRGMWCGQ